MENCFEQFRINIICCVVGILLIQPSTALCIDSISSPASDGKLSNQSSKLSLDRSDFGLTHEENIFTPSLAASLEYNDNIFETQADRRSDFLTHVTPGIGIRYRAPFWDWDLSYLLDYLNYARNTRSYELNHTLDVKGDLKLIDNLLYLDISDTYKKVSLDVNRDTTTSSSFVNQADQNILTLAPRIELRLRSNLLLTSAYHYTKESYLGASSVGSSASAVDKEEHGVIVTTTYELTPKSTLAANLQYTYVLPGNNSKYHQVLPTLRVRHEFAEGSFITLEGGYSWFIYANGPSANGPYWNAGITYSFNRCVASFNALVRYNTDPLRGSTEERSYSGSIVKTLNRGSVGLSAGYSELFDKQADKLASTRLWAGINLRHDLSEKVVGHLDLNGEKVDVKDNSNINNDNTAPYRFHINAGASYAMANHLSLTLDYTYTTYRQSITRTENNTEINRVILAVSKSF